MVRLELDRGDSLVGGTGLCCGAAAGHRGKGRKEGKTCRGSGACCAAAIALVGFIPAHAALSAGADAVHVRSRFGNFYSAAGAPTGRGRSRIIVAVVDSVFLQSGHLYLGRATGR